VHAVVIAGVLRGQRSRFQLFGDTVNTASRMESTGVKSRIQISGTTAVELKRWDRASWVKPRAETVSAKGKGEMQTYWLLTKLESIEMSKKGKVSQQGQVNVGTFPNLRGYPQANDVHHSDEQMLKRKEGSTVELTTGNIIDEDGDGSLEEVLQDNMTTKVWRLVEWNVKVLSKLLQQILAARDSTASSQEPGDTLSLARLEDELQGPRDGWSTTVLGEFKDIITLPVVSPEELQRRKDPHSIELPESVVCELRDFLTLVAAMYRPNAFHNFEHASHVAASVSKLLTRIVNADHIVNLPDDGKSQKGGTHTKLVDLAGHSYGIASDPVTQFAVVFSAIIHDADHPGVPNAVLVQEDTPNARIYKKSIAEQNSVDLVWGLLMAPEYAHLRACIYSNKEELRRFRQLVVNTVMATDIVDKELQALRKARWETAFSDKTESSLAAAPRPVDALSSSSSSLELESMHRKATIVIEHLIQASDVAHTMQHWHVYKQWNERFFQEQYTAYQEGRTDTDPSIHWYDGEISFFDFYIIPLAKKLESCGCFGVSSHEYLNYAVANREEWGREGKGIVEEYVRTFEEMVVMS
jgi:hypothetical protein